MRRLSEITSRGTAFDEFLAFLENTPPVCSLVKGLTLVGALEAHQMSLSVVNLPVCEMYYLSSLANKLSRLHSLHLRRLALGKECPEPQPLTPITIAEIPQVRSLFLHCVLLARRSSLGIWDVLQPFTGLKELTADMILGVQDNALPPSQSTSAPPFELRSLSIAGFTQQFGTLLRILYRKNCLGKLLTLRVPCAIPTEVAILAAILPSIGPHLLRLELCTAQPENGEEISFITCTSLLSLHVNLEIDGTLPNSPLIWNFTFRVLSEVGRTLQHIVFTLEFRPGVNRLEELEKAVNWERMKEIIYRFIDLRDLTILVGRVPPIVEDGVTQPDNIVEEKVLITDKLCDIHPGILLVIDKYEQLH